MAPIRLGMVGGGQGAFIGAVHRIAARLDGQFELVAGALSSDRARAAASAAELGLARSYASWAEMAKTEAARPDGIEAVAVVTPNHLHAAPAVAFLRAGIHVICDKPLAATMAEAEEIAAAARASRALFFLTHNYPGAPMVREARAMVAAGALGTLRMVEVEYVQDWLTRPVESKQADWRTDPARAGAGCLGDIGTHAWNLARFVSRLEPEALAAEVTSFVPGRRVDDNVTAHLRFRGGARGRLWASQVAVGHENGLRLRLYGEAAGLEWAQEEPNRLWFTRFGEPKRLLTRGGAGTGPAAAGRVPAGHPEGYLEGFGTIYADIAAAIRKGSRAGCPVAGIEEGLEGMRFIAACLASSAGNGAWVPMG